MTNNKFNSFRKPFNCVYLFILMCFVLFCSVGFAQQKLDNQELETAIQLNRQNKMSDYFGLEKEYIIKTNVKKINKKDSIEVFDGIKKLRGVVDCKLFTDEYVIKVKSAENILAKKNIEFQFVSVEEIKAALILFGL